VQGPVAHPYYTLLVARGLLDGITSHGLALSPHLRFRPDFARMHVLNSHKLLDSKDFACGRRIMRMKDGLPASVNA